MGGAGCAGMGSGERAGVACAGAAGGGPAMAAPGGVSCVGLPGNGGNSDAAGLVAPAEAGPGPPGLAVGPVAAGEAAELVSDPSAPGSSTARCTSAELSGAGGAGVATAWDCVLVKVCAMSSAACSDGSVGWLTLTPFGAGAAPASPDACCTVCTASWAINSRPASAT